MGVGSGGGDFMAVDIEQQTLASTGKAGKTGNGAVTFCEEAGKGRMERDDSSVLICPENSCGLPKARGPSNFPPFASDFVAKCHKSSLLPCQHFNREVKVLPTGHDEHSKRKTPSPKTGSAGVTVAAPSLC